MKTKEDFISEARHFVLEVLTEVAGKKPSNTVVERTARKIASALEHSLPSTVADSKSK